MDLMIIYSVCTLRIYTFLVFGYWILPKRLSTSHVKGSCCYVRVSVHILVSIYELVVTLALCAYCGNMSQYDANISAPLIMSHTRLYDVCTFILGI